MTKMPSYNEVISEARRTYKMRLRRDRFLDAPDMRDPQWDMLVDLFVNKIDGKRVSVSSLCLASHVPSTTSLRHIGLLLDAGLITRTACPSDKRKAYLELSNDSFERMFDYFAEAVRLRHADETSIGLAAPGSICCPAHEAALQILQDVVLPAPFDSPRISTNSRIQ